MSESNPTDASPEPREIPAERPPHRLLLGVTLIVVAAAAGLVTGLLGESDAVKAKPELVWMVTMGNRHTATTAMTVEAAGVTNVARVQAILGLSLGLATGIVAALAFHNPRRLVHAAMTGLFTGATVGFGVAKLAVPLFYRYRTTFELDLLPSILLHGGLAASIGLTTALAAAVGASYRRAKLLESLFTVSFAALLGGTLYVILGAAFFANDDTGEPISLTAVTRILSPILVALFIALGTSLTLIPTPKTTPKPAATA